jgi:hypothetical protein
VRLATLLLAFGGASLFMRTFGSTDVDLALVLPAEAGTAQGVDVRVLRSDGRQVLRARQQRRSDARTVMLRTRLPRGALSFEAWTYGPGGEQALFGAAEYAGDGFLEVELAPRP